MSFQEVQLNQIKPSPMNPRKHFGGPKDDEMVASVRAKGVLQPIVIRPMPSDDGFEIVAGERRWRAACTVAKDKGGLKGSTIPAMVRAMSDEEAFEVMCIENLQREDLSEREEADGFKAYLDRKGEDALPDLASRTGIDPRYIRRRVRILTLPKEVLEAWEKGKLSYGHLEQLRRLEDKEESKRLFKEALRCPVAYLKDQIDRMAVPLGKAQFKTSDAGCSKCLSNSTVQKDLFGAVTQKAVCLDPKCFLEKTKTWLTENWEKSEIRKKYQTNGFRTNGFRLYDYERGANFERFWKGVPKKECKACEYFLTILDAADPSCVYSQISCYNPACFAKIYGKSSSSGRLADPKEKAEHRSTEHGLLFREEFFQTRIPLAFAKVDPEDPRVDALALLSLLSSNRSLHSWFYNSLPPDEQKTIDVDRYGPEESWFSMPQDEIARILKRLPIQFIRMLLHGAALETVMQEKFGHDGRYRVGAWLGMDLQTEWTLTQEYLMAKTKAEMLSMGESLGILKDPKAQAFLYEKLGKKRGKWENCKKGELIRVFLESGVDLAGKVPDEILVKEQKCRVCGCTDDHACPGGCHWVEEDLCSVCQEKSKAAKKRKKSIKPPAKA